MNKQQRQAINQAIQAANGLTNYLNQLACDNDIAGLIKCRSYYQDKRSYLITTLNVPGYRSQADTEIWAKIDKTDTHIQAVETAFIQVNARQFRRYLYQISRDNLPDAQTALSLAQKGKSGLTPQERMTALNLIEKYQLA